MIELLGFVCTVLAVTGVLFNNHKKRACFILWMLSNGTAFFIHAKTGVVSLAIRDIIFTSLAIHGWYLWGRNENNT